MKTGVAQQSSLWSGKALNSWGLFWLVAAGTGLAIVFAMPTVDLAGPLGVSSMIQLSVRVAVPWLFLAFAASSLAALFPGAFSRWLLRNRRILGLCFAAGMGWQLFFILWLVIGHWGYYLEEVYSYFDLAVQAPGYLVLFAMSATSFRFGRAKLTPKQWKALHKGGIYFLWAVVWSTYWYELFYYDDIQPIDYAYYWAGFAVWGLRVAAWSKRPGRRMRTPLGHQWKRLILEQFSPSTRGKLRL